MKVTTLTLSPAVDIEYHTSVINSAGLNRAVSHTVTAGGKGINVSRAILALAREDGVDLSRILRTVAPTGGVMGDLLRKILSEEGIGVTAVQIDGETRVNTSLISDSNEQSSIEINAPGTPIGERLMVIENMILSSLGEGDVVAICGSCPSDVRKDYPAELCRRIKKLGGYVIIDCDGAALDHALKIDENNEDALYPDVIKPNLRELGGFVGREISTVDEVSMAAEAVVRSTGMKTAVITTMAGDGAVFTSASGDAVVSKFFPARERSVVRLKGAGDTFLGTYIYERFILGKSDDEAISIAVERAGDYVEGV